MTKQNDRNNDGGEPDERKVKHCAIRLFKGKLLVEIREAKKLKLSPLSKKKLRVLSRKEKCQR